MKREPERKETLGERVETAIAKVSTEVKEHAPAKPLVLLALRRILELGWLIAAPRWHTTRETCCRVS